jgi:hypothetical protein
MHYGEQQKLVREAFDDPFLATRGGHERRVICPACPELTGKVDHRQCLSINSTSGFYRCWKCGIVGRLRELGDDEDDYDEGVEQDTSDAELANEWSLPEGFYSFESIAGSVVGSVYLAYLMNRHVRTEALRSSGVGICLGGRFGGRIIVPVHDTVGDLRGWVGRTVTGVRAHVLPDVPYLYPKGFRRDEVLFNEATMKRPQAEILLEGGDVPRAVLIVEGVFDALCHWPYAVACLGKPTHSHVNRIERSNRPVVVCLDGDAWEEGQGLCRILALRGIECGYIQLPPGTDPAEVDPIVMRVFMENALSEGACIPGRTT